MNYLSMRVLLSILFFSILAGCDQSQPTSAATQPASAGGATFQFSKKPPVNDLDDMDTWCNHTFFNDAVLINADPANSNRRHFLLTEGVYRIRLQLGNAASSFFLQKTAASSIEIFTSDNYPLCSSNRANFALAGEGAWIRYDNERGINYTVETQASAEGLFVVLTLPPTPVYGLDVHRCVNCR